MFLYDHICKTSSQISDQLEDLCTFLVNNIQGKSVDIEKVRQGVTTIINLIDDYENQIINYLNQFKLCYEELHWNLDTDFNDPLRILLGTLSIFDQNLDVQHVFDEVDSLRNLWETSHFEDDLGSVQELFLALDQLLQGKAPNLDKNDWETVLRKFQNLHQEHHSLLYQAILTSMPKEIVLVIMEKTASIDENTAFALSTYLSQFNDARKKAINQVTNALTINRNGISQAGRIPKAHIPVIQRPPRTFSNERSRQLLKQLATQLYFALNGKINVGKLVEVQFMYLVFAQKANLFIAVNESKVSGQVADTLMLLSKDFHHLLRQNYSPSSSEGKRRSARYSQKLSNRVLGAVTNIPASEDPQDHQDALMIAKIIKEANLIKFTYNSSEQMLNVLNNLAGGAIYVISAANVKPTLRRHAEEFLCDIFDQARIIDPQAYGRIAGKKRPCFGCSGRLQASGINFYGQRNGFFWVNTVENQPLSVVKTTIQKLVTECAHVTQGIDEREYPDYDSASTSSGDLETDEGNYQFTL